MKVLRLHLLSLSLCLFLTLTFTLVPPTISPAPGMPEAPHHKLLPQNPIPGRPNDPKPSNSPAIPGLPRPVWLISDQMPAPWTFLGGAHGNNPQMNSHFSVHVGGNADNGPMRITMKNSSGVIVVDATDWGTNNSFQPIGLAPTAQRIRQVVDVGMWIGKNVDLMHPTTGQGLIAKAWSQGAVYEAGVNGCGRLAVGVLGLMNIKIPPNVLTRLQSGGEFLKAVGAKTAAIEAVQVRYNKLLQWGKPAVQRNAWGLSKTAGASVPEGVSGASQGRPRIPTVPGGGSGSGQGRPRIPTVPGGVPGGGSGSGDGRARIPTKPNSPNPVLPDANGIVWGTSPEGDIVGHGTFELPLDEHLNVIHEASSVSVDATAEFEDEAWVVPAEDRPPPIAMPFQESKMLVPGVAAAGGADAAKAASAADAFMLVRAGGSKALVKLGARTAIMGAGLALGPAFVILDFVHGDWVGGALATVGTVLETALAAVELSVADVPIVGWLADIAIAVLFFILPGLIHKKVHYGSNTNATEIIQYAMFGDARHTGNEKCKQGNPACQVVYGPSVMANVFKWELFDAITFMIQFNHGLTMTIPDMGKAFTSVDPWAGTTNPGITPQIATITCTNQGGKDCEGPAFKLDRAMITLPNIGQTADKVYPRIVNAQGQGDCKIVAASMSGMNFPDYNYTLLNTPVSIACGLGTVDVNANAVAYGTFGGSSSPGTTSNPASQSTDGNGGEAQTAFSGTQTAFAALLSSTNGLCLSGSKGSICLPNGTYAPQTGGMGYNSQYTTDMTLPPSGGKLVVNAMVSNARKRSAESESEPLARMLAEDSFEELSGLFGRAPDSGFSWSTVLGPQMHAFEFDQNQSKSSKDFVRAFSALGSPSSGNIEVLTPSAPVPPGACLFTQTNFNGDVFCVSLTRRQSMKFEQANDTLTVGCWSRPFAE